MKMKNISILLLSLLFSLSALRAAPVDPDDPSTPSTPSPPSTPSTSDDALTLTSDDSNTSVQVTTSKIIDVVLFATAYNEQFTLSESSLCAGNQRPYSFNADGQCIDKKSEHLMWNNLGWIRKDPLLFLASSRNLVYLDNLIDPEDPTSGNSPDLPYLLCLYYTFEFKANVAGETTLTIDSDLGYQYIYHITVVDAPAN